MLTGQLQQDTEASVDQRTQNQSQSGGTEGLQCPVICSYQVGRTWTSGPGIEEWSHLSGSGYCYGESLYSAVV